VTPQAAEQALGLASLNVKHEVLQDQDFFADGLGGVVGECEVLECWNVGMDWGWTAE